MKRTFIYIISIAALAATTVSCEDFFNRSPHNKIDAEMFLQTENDLKIYSNGLTNTYILGTSVAIGNNAYTDLCATKLSTDKYHPGIWNANKGGGWSSGSWSSTPISISDSIPKKGAGAPDFGIRLDSYFRFLRETAKIFRRPVVK